MLETTHTPDCKIHFINHPRYGKVYPVVVYDFDKDYYKLPIFSLCAFSSLNLTVLYGSFVSPIFTPTAAAILCNPLFLLPALYVNAMMYQMYQPLILSKDV